MAVVFYEFEAETRDMLQRFGSGGFVRGIVVAQLLVATALSGGAKALSSEGVAGLSVENRSA